MYISVIYSTLCPHIFFGPGGGLAGAYLVLSPAASMIVEASGDFLAFSWVWSMRLSAPLIISKRYTKSMVKSLQWNVHFQTLCACMLFKFRVYQTQTWK